MEWEDEEEAGLEGVSDRVSRPKLEEAGLEGARRVLWQRPRRRAVVRSILSSERGGLKAKGLVEFRGCLCLAFYFSVIRLVSYAMKRQQHGATPD